MNMARQKPRLGTIRTSTDRDLPFMDEIGRNGIRFTQFRVNPLCTPTRSSVMTGLYSLENGMWRGPGLQAELTFRAGSPFGSATFIGMP